MKNSRPAKIAMFRNFHDRFIKELPVRLDSIQKAWEKDESSEVNSQFYRLVHSLVGSAGTFGFPVLGSRAQELELFLKQINTSQVDSKSQSLINQSILDLKNIADDGPDIGPPSHEPYPSFEHESQKKQLIYLLEDNAEIAREIVQQLTHHGYLIEVFNDVNALKVAVAKTLPDILFLEMHLSKCLNAGSLVAVELQLTFTIPIPIIFISGSDSWNDRLSAVRAGGQSYLTKPINFNYLLDELGGALNQEALDPIRVLIVDDTVLLAEHYSGVLSASGMRTEVLNKPNDIFDKLSDFHPDLILMDVYMPGCSGIEATKVIRQNPIYSNLPVVYLSTEKALDKQLEANGDGFLTKPISDEHLVTAVRNEARRFREMTALITQDSLTGLLNHTNLKLALEREISLAQRRGSSLSFVMLDIDHFKLVNDNYGHPIGDIVIKSLARMLSQRLRKGDIAARYGGEEFAVILPDTPLSDAFDLLDALRLQFKKYKFTYKSIDFNVTLSAGISIYLPGKCVDSLIADADNALYQAKHAGRDQVKLSKK